MAKYYVASVTRPYDTYGQGKIFETKAEAEKFCKENGETTHYRNIDEVDSDRKARATYRYRTGKYAP